MSSRKEQKEALRRERLKREQEAKAAQRRKQLLGYGVGGALALVAVVIVGVLIASGGDGGNGSAEAELYPPDQSIPDPGELSVDLQRAAREAGCELEEKPSPSRQHTTNPEERLRYNLNPPAAGKHYEIPTEDGIFNDQPAKEHLVHTQEHGRVIIWFKRSLPENARGQLRTLFEEDPVQLVLTPDDEVSMPYELAATAWGSDPEPNGTGYLLGCRSFNEQVFDALRAFIGEHRGNGPEPVP